MSRRADLSGFVVASVSATAEEEHCPECPTCSIWLTQDRGDPGDDGSNCSWSVDLYATLRDGTEVFIGNTQTHPPYSYQMHVQGARVDRPRTRVVCIGRVPGAKTWRAVISPPPRVASPNPSRLYSATIGISVSPEGAAGPTFEHEPIRFRRLYPATGGSLPAGTYQVVPGVRLLGVIIRGAHGGAGGTLFTVAGSASWPIEFGNRVTVAADETFAWSLPELPEPTIARWLPLGANVQSDLFFSWTGMDLVVFDLGHC